LLLVLYLCVILFVSTRPELRPPGGLPFADKVAHFVEYGILGWLLSGFLDPGGVGDGRLLAKVLVGTLLVGTLDEAIQSTVPGREASLWDLGADVTGGFVAGWIWIRQVARRWQEGG
jgi:VanZ family protein